MWRMEVAKFHWRSRRNRTRAIAVNFPRVVTSEGFRVIEAKFIVELFSSFLSDLVRHNFDSFLQTEEADFCLRLILEQPCFFKIGNR